jgi:predicted AAA+ superfamily ATPase
MASSRSSYQRRVVDDELDELIESLPAIAIDGPKGVGKTTTAKQRASTVHELDDPEQLEIALADPKRLLEGERPVLIDEWQRLPEVWDLVRRAVDDGAPAGSFLLAGSAIPNPPPAHSGAGRIPSVNMRPLAMSERAENGPVSLAALLEDPAALVEGSTEVDLDAYVGEILGSGFPALRRLGGRPQRTQIDGYIRRMVERDIPDDAGIVLRKPETLRRWMAAYAAASSTTTSLERIRDAATGGQDQKPARNTATSYRDALERIWVIDEVPAWVPTNNRLKELGASPKRQLSDPALAAQLLKASRSTLLGSQPATTGFRNDGTLLGALFESLVTLSVRVYAQHSEAKIGHLRTARGNREVDLIVERRDGGLVAIEVKLARAATAADGKHLRWLKGELGDRVINQLIVTTGTSAYRRKDGIAVVPLALLAP